MKRRKAGELGCHSPHVHLPQDATTADAIAAVEQLNADPSVDAMLVQHPAPAHIDFDAVLMAVDPDKDVDGMHPTNVGRLALGIPRSEEHTSELQSLMRISYAVFCLKK